MQVFLLLGNSECDHLVVMIVKEYMYVSLSLKIMQLGQQLLYYRYDYAVKLNLNYNTQLHIDIIGWYLFKCLPQYLHKICWQLRYLLPSLNTQ